MWKSWLSLAFVAACALSACDRPHWTGPDQLATDPPPPQTSASITTRKQDLPTLPSWSAHLIGRPVATAFPNKANCQGNLDVVAERYTGAHPGAKVIGWGWASQLQKPIDRVVLVDSDGKIVGAGEGGLSRPDVPANSRIVKSPNTGWQALTVMTTGSVDAFGIVDRKSLCPLGHLAL